MKEIYLKLVGSLFYIDPFIKEAHETLVIILSLEGLRENTRTWHECHGKKKGSTIVRIGGRENATEKGLLLWT